MGLSEKEKKMLAALQKKAEEPDAPPVGKSISIHLDLGNADQVAQAKKYGFLPNDLDDEEEEEEKEEETTPRRRGYFPEKGDK